MAVIRPSLLERGKPPLAPLRRFTVREYRLLGEAGVLTEHDRVELLEGWIVQKMIHNPRHDATVAKANNAIRERLPPGWDVRVQSAMTTEDSEPEPDLAVVRAPESRFATRHPAAHDIALLVEVGDTSLAHDRDFKGALYARAGVRLYRIINLVEKQVEVYTDPTDTAGKPHFKNRMDFTLGESVPLQIEGQEVGPLAVEAILVP
jgi:hypothetical protein